MPRIVAGLDADVLVPILSCDFLLTAFDLGLYEPVVSEAVLAEVERNLVADFPHLDPSRLKRRVGQMRSALEDNLVTGSEVDVPDDVNPKDRHVIAAALAGEASIVVTNDKRLRSETNAAGLSLEAISADGFAARLWNNDPDGINAVIDRLVSKRTRNPITPEDLASALRGPFPSMLASRGASERA